MSRSAPSLLTRLRRHRGLWVLAVAVLLIKFASGTVCLVDGPETRFAATGASTTTVSVPMETMATVVSGEDTNTCLLGEVGGCHCACAHTVMLPATATSSIARMDARPSLPVISSGFDPATPRSLLRPPIA